MRLWLTLLILCFSTGLYAAPHATKKVEETKTHKTKKVVYERKKMSRPPVQVLKKPALQRTVQTRNLIAERNRSGALKRTSLQKRTATTYTRKSTLKRSVSTDLALTSSSRRGQRSTDRRFHLVRQTAMNNLMKQLGKPYQWGGASPNTGFDCSGLVYYAYRNLLKIELPRTANEMFHLREAPKVRQGELQKGDLVFFRINNRGTADHVGVYLGDDRFIQSPRTGKDIQISQLSDDYWQDHYVGARRLLTPKTIR